uniref:F-box protein CPR1-like n=1 Tax=Erigeron canadensis TaxID=72917 RepID=UPI001CB95CFA|nr:F-box protein CPR1-like [Erigeron canadensis]
MEELPDDVLSRILIWLPAKLLAQSRCVCRHWNALLYQPSFIYSHLKQQCSLIHNNNGNILLLFDNLLRRHRPCTVHSTFPHIELTNFIKFPVNFPSKDRFFSSVIGSANGLIYFFRETGPTNINPMYTIYIWNPSLSALMTLPPFTLPLGTAIFYRFWFDPKTDDYMMVKLTCSPDETYTTVFPEVVEVYSMRRGSWQLTAERFPSQLFIPKHLGDQALLDGHHGKVHWLGYVPPSRLNMILAFDLGVQTFSEISLPDSVCYFDENRNLALAFIDGKLCVMTSVRGSDQCEVWVMDEYYAWVKRHMFSQLSLDNDITPVGLTLNGEFLFRTD